MSPFFEPYRIKSVEPIKCTTVNERKSLIESAHYNLFGVRAEDVMLDFLTDSGTSAMSTEQWAGMMRADESYAGAKSYYRFMESLHSLMPFKHVFPTHQGRAAERVLFRHVLKEGNIVPNNTHFDTTRANIELRNAQADDLIIKDGLDIRSDHPFKGNMDCAALRKLLKEKADIIPLVMITITNNAGGGQPVSMENIRETKKICNEFKKPLFIDACRFSENAYFIQQREKGYEHKSVRDITIEMFSYADGMTMSAKKDPMVNIGGWLAMNDDNWAEEIQELLIVTEGFTTYGGLSGRALEAMAIGLQEAVDERYLESRIQSVKYLGDGLSAMNIPIVQPTGGHAIFIDAREMLPHIAPLAYPGQSLTVALYEEGGIRGVEIGSVMFGKQPDGREKAARLELVRLAIPRRVYTRSHMDYAIECLGRIYKYKDSLGGYKITSQPKHLRHFTAKFSKL